MIILITFILTGYGQHKKMLRKMNIKNLPDITNVTYVKKKSNFVSRNMMYMGDEDAFENYALKVYEYLKETHYDSLGYSTEWLESFLGFGGTDDYFNQSTEINQFRKVSFDRIAYEFIFSKDDTFLYNKSNNTQYVNNATIVTIVYFNEVQDENKKPYNIGISLFIPLKVRNRYAHVNSGKFSSYIYKYTHKLETKELLMNLFLDEYDITKLSKEELKEYLGFDDRDGDNLIYYYGVNEENKASQALKVYYDDNNYVNHEIYIPIE